MTGVDHWAGPAHKRRTMPRPGERGIHLVVASQ